VKSTISLVLLVSVCVFVTCQWAWRTVNQDEDASCQNMQITIHILKIPSIYRVVQKQQVAYCYSYDVISGDIFDLKIIYVLVFIMPTKTFSFSFFILF